MGKIVAICISEKKGTGKTKIDACTLIENHGLESDAHAGDWHRQVSLLGATQIEEFNARGGQVEYGDFGENLVIDGIDLRTLVIGQKLHIGDVELEITQLGKECHTRCAIFHRVGDCIMPKNGIFAKVLRGGPVTLFDTVSIA